MIHKIKQATNWEERYRLIILAGKNISQPTEQELAEMEEIRGCEAKVWFKSSPKTDRTFEFQAYSEARIINGLLWILLQEINNKNAQQLAEFDLTTYFNELGIAQRLSNTRLNGLKEIEKKIKQLIVDL
ncbi:SufE family protein [Haemophilus haemoglobinophilus]|nr:SufE family protein [Canicola haemoglobinophilus]MBN6712131.1 SufE family protein [Canicola haemoglobinophilus]